MPSRIRPPGTGPVLAANVWPSNAHLIVDVARLGYIKRDDLVLDPTYWKGGWWKLFRPENLFMHDIRIDGVDFRDLPWRANQFDVVAFDPPYVSMGGRRTSTIPEFTDQYGLLDAPESPEALQLYCNAGLRECRRVVKRGGYILQKCSNYVSSGHFYPGVYQTQKAGEKLHLRQVDQFDFVDKPRAQQKGRTRKVKRRGKEIRVPTRQHHARNNVTVLLVWQKP